MSGLRSRQVLLGGLALFLALGLSPAHAPADADTQALLGPGLYVFQTRLDHATCGESSTTGNVTSYFAAVDGKPGSRTMTMTLMNSPHWPTWTLSITPAGKVVGDAQQAGVTGPHRGEAHFEVALARGKKDKFVGRGSRAWSMREDGEMKRCRMAFDALLRPLHEN